MDVLVLIDKLDDLVHNAKAVPLTDQVRIARVCGWGTFGAWTAGHQRSTMDCCGLMEFRVDLARSHGAALVNNLLLISHGRGPQRAGAWFQADP